MMNLEALCTPITEVKKRKKKSKFKINGAGPLPLNPARADNKTDGHGCFRGSTLNFTEACALSGVFL